MNGWTNWWTLQLIWRILHIYRCLCVCACIYGKFEIPIRCIWSLYICIHVQIHYCCSTSHPVRFRSEDNWFDEEIERKKETTHEYLGTVNFTMPTKSTVWWNAQNHLPRQHTHICHDCLNSKHDYSIYINICI